MGSNLWDAQLQYKNKVSPIAMIQSVLSAIWLVGWLITHIGFLPSLPDTMDTTNAYQTDHAIKCLIGFFFLDRNLEQKSMAENEVLYL